jgi:hydrogenase nickel incorporation protein HypA/HybF
MHELAVAQALVEQVSGIALQHGAFAVASLRVKIGPLSGVEPALLAAALPLAAAGSVLENARLDLVPAPITVRCETCGAISEAQPNRLLCADCGDWHTKLVSGDELLLDSVELETGDHGFVGRPSGRLDQDRVGLKADPHAFPSPSA